MKLAQITESLHKKYLVETIKNNTFYRVSSRKLDGKPEPGPEGIHINQSISGIKTVKEERYSNKDAYLYIINLNDGLSLYSTDKDPGRWDAKNLATLLLKDKTFSDSLNDEEKLLLKQLENLRNGESNYSDLQKIQVIMNKQGYNAIAYVNDYEPALKPSIMLFDNKLIKNYKYKGKI